MNYAFRQIKETTMRTLLDYCKERELNIKNGEYAILSLDMDYSTVCKLFDYVTIIAQMEFTDATTGEYVFTSINTHECIDGFAKGRYTVGDIVTEAGEAVRSLSARDPLYLPPHNFGFVRKDDIQYCMLIGKYPNRSVFISYNDDVFHKLKNSVGSIISVIAIREFWNLHQLQIDYKPAC